MAVCLPARGPIPAHIANCPVDTDTRPSDLILAWVAYLLPRKRIGTMVRDITSFPCKRDLSCSIQAYWPFLLLSGRGFVQKSTAHSFCLHLGKNRCRFLI